MLLYMYVGDNMFDLKLIEITVKHVRVYYVIILVC